MLTHYRRDISNFVLFGALKQGIVLDYEVCALMDRELLDESSSFDKITRYILCKLVLYNMCKCEVSETAFYQWVLL